MEHGPWTYLSSSQLDGWMMDHTPATATKDSMQGKDGSFGAKLKSSSYAALGALSMCRGQRKKRPAGCACVRCGARTFRLGGGLRPDGGRGIRILRQSVTRAVQPAAPGFTC
jgi:hypothetical protein